MVPGEEVEWSGSSNACILHCHCAFSLLKERQNLSSQQRPGFSRGIRNWSLILIEVSNTFTVYLNVCYVTLLSVLDVIEPLAHFHACTLSGRADANHCIVSILIRKIILQIASVLAFFR